MTRTYTPLSEIEEIHRKGTNKLWIIQQPCGSLKCTFQGMEDPFINDEYDIMEFLDEDQISALLEENFPSHTSPLSNSNSNLSTLIPRNDSSTTICTMEAPRVHAERPAKQQKPNWQEQLSHSPMILTFGNKRVPEKNNQNVVGELNHEDELVSEVLMSSRSYTNLEEAAKSGKAPKKSCGRKRPPSQTYDHILAERKRREQLSQRFVALSAIVPGLKKMDKTSVLGDAINYLKHLQERVKTLEEQSTKQTMESIVIVKKSQVFIEDEGSSDETVGGSDEQPLPEIEAKVCDKSVLLRVHCHKNKGVLVNLLSEVEKLNLTVTSTNVAPFGSLALDITIIAEMEQEFNVTIKDLIVHLQSALQRPTQVE